MRVFGYIIVGLLVWLAVIVTMSMMNTAGTVATTPGRVIQKTLETDNVIQSYEWFFDVNANYEARTDQIEQYAIILEEETDRPERSRLRLELAAMQQSCRSLSQDYNSYSEKMNKKFFKAKSLPETLDTTKCEITT